MNDMHSIWSFTRLMYAKIWMSGWSVFMSVCLAAHFGTAVLSSELNRIDLILHARLDGAQLGLYCDCWGSVWTSCPPSCWFSSSLPGKTGFAWIHWLMQTSRLLQTLDIHMWSLEVSHPWTSALSKWSRWYRRYRLVILVLQGLFWLWSLTDLFEFICALLPVWTEGIDARRTHFAWHADLSRLLCLRVRPCGRIAKFVATSGLSECPDCSSVVCVGFLGCWSSMHFVCSEGIYKPTRKSWNLYMGGHAVTGESCVIDS